MLAGGSFCQIKFIFFLNFDLFTIDESNSFKRVPCEEHGLPLTKTGPKRPCGNKLSLSTTDHNLKKDWSRATDVSTLVKYK